MDPPISRSRLEINFIRLLEETQQMANGNKQKNWTFEKYIGWLLEKIPEMEKSPNAPNEETLKHYKRQVDFLRGVLEAENCEQVLDSGTATQMIPHGPATTSDHTLTQQIHQRAQAKTTNRLRQDLLGLVSRAVESVHRTFDSDSDSSIYGTPDSDSDSSIYTSGENELRNQKEGLSGGISAEDFQSQLLSDEQKREKMVEDMITMTREWKEQSKIANKIIKKDIDILDKSSKHAEVNQTHLKVESNRLAEYNKRACNFWIWIMIILVCFTFIGMVVFIRIFPKRQAY